MTTIRKLGSAAMGIIPKKEVLPKGKKEAVSSILREAPKTKEGTESAMKEIDDFFKTMNYKYAIRFNSYKRRSIDAVKNLKNED